MVVDEGAENLVRQIYTALPQTQCTRCGYPDCQTYAEAIVAGDGGINQCPPGGAEGIERLSRITGHVVQTLNPGNGVESTRSVVYIDENWCIGCTLCINACPVDAIVGSNKRMHTVIEPLCTGCELCLPVCPVDCILLENASEQRTGWAAWSQQQANTAKERYAFHVVNVQALKRKNNEKLEKKALEKLADLPAHSQHTDAAVLDKKRSVIEAALAKARSKRL